MFELSKSILLLHAETKVYMNQAVTRPVNVDPNTATKRVVMELLSWKVRSHADPVANRAPG